MLCQAPIKYIDRMIDTYLRVFGKKPKGRSDNYDMIIGRDLLKVLNIQLSFADSIIRIKDAEIPMRPRDVRSLKLSWFIQLTNQTKN